MTSAGSETLSRSGAAADFHAPGGLTVGDEEAFRAAAAGLRGGLSSRVVVGEAGPIHLVRDPLAQDARMVPLFRAMAAYADASARGEAAPAVETPYSVPNPFQQ